MPIRTVNRQCSSGLQAVADVAAYIKAGFYDIGKATRKFVIISLFFIAMGLNIPLKYVDVNNLAYKL